MQAAGTGNSMNKRRKWCLILVIGVLILIGCFLYHVIFPRGQDRPGLFSGIRGHSQSGDTTQSRLLILAYMRTGSSMTGNLLQSDPDVFYWFEPLRMLAHAYRKNNMNVSKWERRRQFSQLDATAGNLTALLTCQPQHAFQPALADVFMTHNFSRTTGSFRRCSKSSAGRAQNKENCLLELTRSCKGHGAVVVKTIRFSVAAAVSVLRQDDSLKVVHLVRDPRAVLRSRRRVRAANFSNLAAESKGLCLDMSRDIDAMLGQGEGLRRRYMLVRYEDIAANPQLLTASLFRFLGLPLSGPASDFARSLSGESPARSQRWRRWMRYEDVVTISGHCESVLRDLGYRASFQDEQELRDGSVSGLTAPRVNVESCCVDSGGGGVAEGRVGVGDPGDGGVGEGGLRE